MQLVQFVSAHSHFGLYKHFATTTSAGTSWLCNAVRQKKEIIKHTQSSVCAACCRINMLILVYVYMCGRRRTALVGPHMQLLGQLRNHQERPPALTLLRFENVTKNVVSDVDDVLSFSTQQVTDDVRRT